MESKCGEEIQEVFAEWVGVEYTVAVLTQKDNICRHTQTHTHFCTNGGGIPLQHELDFLFTMFMTPKLVHLAVDYI